MHHHLLPSRGAPDPQVSHRCFFAGQRLFLRDGIPLPAFLENRVLNVLPNHGRPRQRQRLILRVFISLLFFRQLRCQVFLRRLLRALIPHSPHLPNDIALFYTTSNIKPAPIWRAVCDFSFLSPRFLCVSASLRYISLRSFLNLPLPAAAAPGSIPSNSPAILGLATPAAPRLYPSLTRFVGARLQPCRIVSQEKSSGNTFGYIVASPPVNCAN